MRVHKAGEGALVHAQRMEQTISPTLHVRILRHAPMCVRVRSYCSGRNGRVTYVTFASVVRVRLYVCASLTPMKGMYAADSLGPEDISQKGRRRSRSNPEGCSFSRPSGSLSSFPPSSSSPRPPALTGWGRRRKLLLCSTFAGNDPATRMRPSLFPFILVPVSGER